LIASDKQQTISRAKDLAEPLDKVEDLADALLDFNAMPDLETWLADHIRKLTL